MRCPSYRGVIERVHCTLNRGLWIYVDRGGANGVINGAKLTLRCGTKNPFESQLTQKILDKFSCPPKSLNCKFQTQTIVATPYHHKSGVRPSPPGTVLPFKNNT